MALWGHKSLLQSRHLLYIRPETRQASMSVQPEALPHPPPVGHFWKELTKTTATHTALPVRPFCCAWPRGQLEKAPTESGDLPKPSSNAVDPKSLQLTGTLTGSFRDPDASRSELKWLQSPMRGGFLKHPKCAFRSQTPAKLSMWHD